MTRDEAKEILGVTQPDQVGPAFRRLSVACHSDGPTPNAERWAQITTARDILSAPLLACDICKGVGRIKNGSITMFCITCDGEGKQRW